MPEAPDFEGDERKAMCPSECNIDRLNLDLATKKIMNGNAKFASGSCQSFNHTSPSASFSFQYIDEEWEILKDERARSLDDDLGVPIHRRTQSIADSAGPPGAMIPHEDFDQTLFGWRIEISNERKEGSCFIAPNGISGPHPQAELEDCIHQLELACYLSTQVPAATCPCMADVSSIEANLRNERFDPEFVLDLHKSCKDPEENNGLPYGLYTKPGNDDWSYNRGATNILQFGIDKASDSSNTEDRKCYGRSFSPTLSADEHGACVTITEQMCERVKTLAPSSLCEDDDDFMYASKPWATCSRMTNNKLGQTKQRRNCERYDEDTDSFVFQKCRKSCQSCICSTTDSTTFRYNGQEDYTCEWIAIKSDEEIAAYCQDNDVAAQCKRTCRTDCCKNNTNFSFKGQSDESNRVRKGGRNFRKTCDDIGNTNWTELCQKKRIALNCPMKCRRCPIQPRILPV